MVSLPIEIIEMIIFIWQISLFINFYFIIYYIGNLYLFNANLTMILKTILFSFPLPMRDKQHRCNNFTQMHVGSQSNSTSHHEFMERGLEVVE